MDTRVDTAITEKAKISVRDLNFYYGGFRALKKINMDLPEHKVTAFIGPSGCGKSTLLRVFNRMFELYPDQRAEGQILLDGDGAGDAEALLLAARQAGAALAQLVLDLVPQRGLFQRPLHTLVHLHARQGLEQLHAEGHVVVDRHREGRGLLEHHADLGADQADVEPLVQDVLAVQQDLALGALLGVELEPAVEHAQQRALA